MTYDEAKVVRDALEAVVQANTKVLKAFPRVGPMNLTPDSVKLSPEFKAAKTAYNRAFSELQNFNEFFVGKFAKQIRADRSK